MQLWISVVTSGPGHIIIGADAEWITEVRTEFDNIQRQERTEISPDA